MEEPFVDVMCRAAAHRGPDGAGLARKGRVILGHRRLSVIDLSDGGGQPMRSPDDRLIITFNGEIYNYLELRGELTHSWEFRTKSDTEVLLAAWDRWGAGCMPKLRGMFAFGIWDNKKAQLTLARDRFGIKPLYYVDQGRRLVFASEIGQLRATGMRLEPDVETCADFLDYGLVRAYGPGTFFQGVSQVLPGTTLTCDAGGQRESRYHDLGQDVEGGRGRNVSEVLRESVRLHLRSDVPIGSCLSGGVDSSTLVALAQEAHSGYASQVVITAGAKEAILDERRWAQTVADELGLKWHVTIPTCSGLLNDIEHLVRSQGEPFSSTGVYAQYCVMRLAKQCGLKVMLDGQGADELFGGYIRHRTAWVRELVKLRLYPEAARALIGAKLGLKAKASLFASAMNPLKPTRALLSRYRREATPSLCGPAMPSRERGRAVALSSSFDKERMHDLIDGSLPALLRYEDRNAMAFSIESRVPYVDHEVAIAALNGRGSVMFRDGWSKAPLRAVLADLLPRELAYRRDKLGFATCESAWFRGELGAFAAEVLSNFESVRLGILDVPAAWRSLELARTGGSTGKAWRTLSMLLWLEWCVLDPSHQGTR